MARRISKAKFFRKIGYNPHPKQLLYHNSEARFKLACCGRRFGKSTMAARDCEPELFLPERRYWVVGPTYLLGEKEFRYIWDDLIVTLGMGRMPGVKTTYQLTQGNMSIEFPWRTRIDVRNAERQKSLVGEGLHGVIMAEAAKHSETTWNQYVRAALADYRGWASFPTTPEGMNWYYHIWKLGRMPQYRGTYESWQFPSWENPQVYPGGRDDEEIRLLEQTLTQEEFDQEIAASFTAVVGRIYGEFDEEFHVREFAYRPNLPTYAFYDFGFTNPFVELIVQIDASDNVYVWDEHYLSRTTVYDHCQILNRMERPAGFHLDQGFGDAEDPEAVAVISQFRVPTMALPEAKENWRDGIDLVKSFLQPKITEGAGDEFGAPLKEPQVFVHPRCTNFIREHLNYRAKKGTRGQNAREVAENVEGHTCDAFRYGLVHIYKLGATYHLADVMSLNVLEEPETFFPQGEFAGITMDDRW